MYLWRLAEDKLAKMLSGNKIILVLGARQVGKTTLVEHILKGEKAVLLNFDVEIDKRRFLAAGELSPEQAMNSVGKPDFLIVDEAQRLPEASRIIKGWYDKKISTRIIMLGSSSLDLLAQATESLTGRNQKLRLPPLLFEETLGEQAWFSRDYTPQTLLSSFQTVLRTVLVDRMVHGSYPEVVTSIDKPGLLRELAADYLWKDILQTGLVKNPDQIKRLLMLLAHQCGSEVSYNELAGNLQMARATVEHYIDLLEQCFIVFRLPAYSTNARKEISKSKKIYFWDTGIRNALLNQFSTDELRPDIGLLWENWVVAEVAKRNMLEGLSCDLYFWRSRHQSEVDLIVKTGTGLKAFEIKWGRKKGTGCRAFANAYGIVPEIVSPANPFVADRVYD
ncbi:MAG: ATP-binding protein [Lentisphaeria bacterium]|nr:ATP-binding protein [Lentisphaeria bacterium]